MKDFRKLQVWEKAHQLGLALYQVTASFPRDETYGLVSQIRRAAASTHPISLKAVAETEIPNCLASALSQEAPPVNWKYQLLLARDLKLSQLNDYEQLSQQTIE